MAESPLTSSLAALSRFFVGDGTLQETLSRVADLTVEAVEPVDLAGITMMVEGRPKTAIFTDELAPEIDQAQYATGEGPCLDAFREQRVMRIDSTLREGPWPAFRDAAADHGIRSTLSLPLLVDKTAVGAMNLYASREHAFGEQDVETASLFASQAAIVLANAQAYWDARELSSGLSEAMEHRSVIEQAKGMLMAAQGIDEDAAFQLLISASQRENVKLRDVAQRIVDGAVARGRTEDDDGDRIVV
ncbi:MAG TPA: GAF and ANTAR domain-containing protein [Acidimicrobiales bacterium]|nr:GAF and ANTAR domain-containing protein [Acidimicrobiales bacterium]